MRRYINILDREINGVLFLDKPQGLSSSFFSNKIKKLFCAKKAGHAGTLDPLATGMLPICFGKATKFAKYLLNADKRYRVVAKLGESTDTFDANGTVIRKSSMRLNNSNNLVEKCLVSFLGKQNQIPPMFSSLKYQGVPLYKYARKGINIIRKSRVIKIYSLNLIEKTENFIKLDIHCSKGTYIRSVINDFGECLGCGAHVVALRRLSVGRYIDSCMINMEILETIIRDNYIDNTVLFHKLDTLLVPMHVIEHECINIF